MKEGPQEQVAKVLIFTAQENHICKFQKNPKKIIARTQKMQLYGYEV
jgi:hypothetical protein